MASTATVQGQQGQQFQPTANGRNEGLRGLDMDEFLKLMITELQNQDPLSPMENSEILQQISQIRSIEASQQETEATKTLKETLDAVLLGQNINSASAMIGKRVSATITVTGKDGPEELAIAGDVKSVSIADGKPALEIHDEKTDTDFKVGMTDVREIAPKK